MTNEHPTTRTPDDVAHLTPDRVHVRELSQLYLDGYLKGVDPADVVAVVTRHEGPAREDTSRAGLHLHVATHQGEDAAHLHVAAGLLVRAVLALEDRAGSRDDEAQARDAGMTVEGWRAARAATKAGDWAERVELARRAGETTRQAEARLLHGPDRPETAQPITAQSVTSLTIGDDTEPATVAVYPVSRLTFGVNLHSLSTRPDLAGVWIDAGTAGDGTTSVRVLTGDSSGSVPTPEALQACAHMLRAAADAVAHASGLDLEVDQ